MIDELCNGGAHDFYQRRDGRVPIVATRLGRKLHRDGGLVGRHAGGVFEVLKGQPRNRVIAVAVDGRIKGGVDAPSNRQGETDAGSIADRCIGSLNALFEIIGELTGHDNVDRLRTWWREEEGICVSEHVVVFVVERVVVIRICDMVQAGFEAHGKRIWFEEFAEGVHARSVRQFCHGVL